jgi:OmpA family
MSDISAYSSSESEALQYLVESWPPLDDGDSRSSGSEHGALEWFVEDAGPPTSLPMSNDTVVEVVQAALAALPALIESMPAMTARFAENYGAANPVDTTGYEATLDTADPSSESLWEYVEATPVHEQDEPEVAFIAAADVLISAAGLGLSIFDRLESHLLKGSFSVNAAGASYIHNPSPRGLAIQTKVFAFPITAFHPRYGISNQTFWFNVTLDYDGFNIRRVSIIEDRGRSSTLISSDFSINFVPSAYTAPNEPVAAIAYGISGRWDPIGSGDESFDGQFIVDAVGTIRGMRVSSSQRWVTVGQLAETGGGPVPRPTTATHVTEVHFDPAGSHHLTEDKIRHLHSFYQGLPSAVQAEIRTGALPIQLLGRASTTGTVQQNQQLARRRADAVAAIFRDLAGSSAQITISAHGELGARTADSVENPNERKVEISIEYMVYRTN